MTVASSDENQTRNDPMPVGDPPGADPLPGNPPCDPSSREAGTSTGINIEPGSDDDGWTVPAPARLRDGTLVQLYKDGEALHAAYRAIEAAAFRICLEVYIFASDETGRAFAELLCRKARDGVAVYVVYDSFGSVGTDRTMFDKMRRSGIRVEEFHPIRPWDVRFSWRPFNRNHRKLLVVDNKIAWMGGMNIGHEYGGSWVIQSGGKCDPWRDNAIGITGPAARIYMSAFARTWGYVLHGGRSRRAELVYDLDVGTPPRTELGLLASVPTMNSPLRPLLHEMFRNARKDISMTMAYFAPDDDLVASMCRAAKRGVRIRLMLPGRSDAKVLITAARWFYDKLLEWGVEIYERQGAVLHAKTIVVDGRISVLGSTNLDYRSIEYNCEISTVVRSTVLGGQMMTLFENDVKYAKRIRQGAWRHRHWTDRLGQWAVSRARYLL